MRPLALGGAALALVAGLLVTGVAGAAATHSRHYKPITNYPAYVGGSGRANPKLSPILIGAVNQQTAPNAPTPLWTTGVKVAVDYANQHTGGIDGHPIKVVYCFIPTTVGDASKCGEEFANNHKI
ncbi:MAG: hypothetical protein ACRDV4_05085, partial [Acidimicrobiales bacterium]